MSISLRRFFLQKLNQVVTACAVGWSVLRRQGPSQIQFWFIALAVGIVAGFAALLFRKGIEGSKLGFMGQMMFIISLALLHLCRGT